MPGTATAFGGFALATFPLATANAISIVFLFCRMGLGGLGSCALADFGMYLAWITEDPMNEDYREMGKVDRVIHEPSRFILTAILYSAESADFNYLLQTTKLNRGNLSSHLTRLEKAGYLKVEKSYRGKTPYTIYWLTREGRRAFREYYEQLKRAAESMPKESAFGVLRSVV